MSFRDLEAGELGDPSTSDYPTGIFIFCPRDDTCSVRRKIFSISTILFIWTTGEDDEEHKMSLRDEELMADLTMEELKQAFR